MSGTKHLIQVCGQTFEGHRLQCLPGQIGLAGMKVSVFKIVDHNLFSFRVYNPVLLHTAKEPEMMLRMQVLKYLYNLSDEHLIEDLSVNLAYKWFVGLNPDDPLPETSLLTKFRTQRLKDISMDTIITEIVRQCIEKGIIEENNGIVIDATHNEANTVKKVPERIMKHLARKIFKAKGQEEYEIPDYTKIENHNEAKQVMKNYLEDLIEQAREE